MSLSIGIVGLPNVGKSTLFNALTKNTADMANYPFCTIDPSVGVVEVPDSRLHALAEFSKTQKTVQAVVEFVDIAGLVKGASAGEGLGNKFLANIRETDAVLEVVRIFDDAGIIHVDGVVRPIDDVQVINLELAMADMSTVEKRITALEKAVRSNQKGAKEEKEFLQALLPHLEEGEAARDFEMTDEQKVDLYPLHLLTMKPILYALNKQAGGDNLDEKNDPRFIELIEYLKERNAHYVLVDAATEHELKDLDDNEKGEFRSDMGISDDGIADLIKAGYAMLGLETFFTTGEKETRAWTIKKNSTAPIAGTAIHNDFKDKFIRADVIEWNKLIEAGSHGKAREQGVLRTEGKEYIVKDGDVIEFRI